MIEVVTGGNSLLYQDALTDMFHLRRRAESPAEAERDEFDTGDAIYLLLTQDDGAVIGAHRLLPTTSPHLFSDVWPEHCAVRGVPRSDLILELSHTFVDEAELSNEAVATARKHLTAGLFEFCLRAGFEKFTVLATTDTLFRYLLAGLEAKPLGLPVDIDGVRHVAVIVTVDRQALEAVRMSLGVAHPIVHHVGALADDPVLLLPDHAQFGPLEAAE